MLELPRRSVTRFFIPLIDVLILLFCIYLLMPIVKTTEGSGEGGAGKALTERERRELAELRRQAAAVKEKDRIVEAERAELEKLRREKIGEAWNQTSIRVLEMENKNGKLVYFDQDTQPIEIRNEAEAHDLVRRDRQRTQFQKLEPYYLIIFPRYDKERTGFPQVFQVRQYDSWFKDAPHRIYNPYASPDDD